MRTNQWSLTLVLPRAKEQTYLTSLFPLDRPLPVDETGVLPQLKAQNLVFVLTDQ